MTHNTFCFRLRQELMKLSRLGRPVMVGISGMAGAGKTTLGKNLAGILWDAHAVTNICIPGWRGRKPG